ncbi:MAG: hypothetical protein GF308_20960 [Candidatus Heimdallarchaeota archaeon]|nr:hypothetical protein [Candidatus Heimdallarchaeota archaeon]
MSKSELFEVLNDQLFDRLVKFDEHRKEILASFSKISKNHFGKHWPNFAETCAKTLDQIATFARLERFEYQETLSENIQSLKNNPQAFEVVSKSRDHSILLEFFARVLSLIYYESILDGLFNVANDRQVIKEHVKQSQELVSILVFSLGKELPHLDEFSDLIVDYGKTVFESQIIERFEELNEQVSAENKVFLLEQKVHYLRKKALLYMNHYSKILELAKEDFWWEDNLLDYYIYAKAEEYLSEARKILLKNPLNPGLLITIESEIAYCKGLAKIALANHSLELTLNSLISENHQQAWEHARQADQRYTEGFKQIEQISFSKDIFDQTTINKMVDFRRFTRVLITLISFLDSINKLCCEQNSQLNLQETLHDLADLCKTPSEEIALFHQSEFFNALGFILDKLLIIEKHEPLTQERIMTEVEEGFQRLGLILKGQIDNASRRLLRLPWSKEQQALETKEVVCESEINKLQNQLISILLIPSFVDSKIKLVAKNQVVLSIANCELARIKSQKESNATKSLCLLVKSYLQAKEAFDHLEEGEVISELNEFVEKEYSQAFVKSHLKETTILQTGNQYFFARYLLRALPGVLAGEDSKKLPPEMAKLLIKRRAGMFDSMIVIWNRLSNHYQTLLEHRERHQPSSEPLLNWFYIEKKQAHTEGAKLFFKSCQAAVQAQEYAMIKERTLGEKLFNEADKYASASAKLFSEVIDTLKGEVQSLPKDLYNFASFCRTQRQKLSQGKKIAEIPIKEFVVLIGVISASL